LKLCTAIAQPSAEIISKIPQDSTKQSETEASLKSTAESFIINTRLVSCAASGSRFACASPGSVAAYHGALSSSPPVFEALFAFKGVYRSLTPFESDLVSDETRITRPNDSVNGQSLDSLQLAFSLNQLNHYKKWRIEGLDRKSSNWMHKAAEIVWNCTHGTISKITMDAVRDVALTKYTCVYSKRKVLYFAKGLLKYLTKTTFDIRFQAFELFLAMPKVLKTRKNVTSRIVTTADVENVLKAIERAYNGGRIDADHYRNFKAIVLFGAFTGQRPLATIARVTVSQFEEAVKMKKPVIDILPEQDKIRMQHYCPLHKQVIEAILPVLDRRRESERVFEQLSFQEWLKHTNIRLLHGGARIVNGDLRKFCEQLGDIIQWDQSNKNYIMTHGVSGVDWRFYKHPLPEHVYDIYMKSWQDVDFAIYDAT
jgi:integrase